MAGNSQETHPSMKAETEPINPVAVDAAAASTALAAGNCYCFHCTKVFAPKAMILHNKNRHGNLGGPTSAECDHCRTLYRTSAEKIIHSRALHGRD